MTDAHNEIFGISPNIRYAAFANGQQVELRSRPNLQDVLGVAARHFPTRRDTGG